MSKKKRILFEVLAPPFSAVLLILIFGFFGSHESVTFSDVLFGFFGFIPLLMFAYAFGIIPAIIYAGVMELWFHFGLRSRLGLLCTVGLSGLLGLGAGFLSGWVGIWLGFLTHPDDYRLAKIGAMVGLLIGYYVEKKQTLAA